MSVRSVWLVLLAWCLPLRAAAHELDYQSLILLSIAAASILAKTYRDEFMSNLAKQFCGYGWETNVGYPTPEHRDGIIVTATSSITIWMLFTTPVCG